MNKFLILFKHELKSQLPRMPRKGRRYDLFGVLLASLVVLFVCAVFSVLLSAIVSTYSTVRIDKVSAPILRSKELINVAYIAVFCSLVCAGLENMRRTLTDRKHRELFLRMPVSSESIVLAKLLTVLVFSYALAFALIATVSVIFYTSSPLPVSFLLRSVAVWVLMPLIAFLVSTLLLVLYIKLVDFISDKYALILIMVTSVLMGAFYVYSRFLSVMQRLIETGSIKYLFNEKFVDTLTSLLKWGYPVSPLSEIALGEEVIIPVLISIALALFAPAFAYLISKTLYTATVYKNDKERSPKGARRDKGAHSTLTSLMIKELICIYRDPKSAFSYLAVAASMPVMVYCSYTLFDSLIRGAIGMVVTFPLATLIVLIFSILTNTFCATNVSRDGAAAMKVKTYPVKASTILLAKVLLCAVVSSLSIAVSIAVLVISGKLAIFDGFALLLIAAAFSMAQIFVATRMDLASAKLSSSLAEMRSANNVTLAKVVTLGILLALLAGMLSVVAYIFSLGSSVSFISELHFTVAHSYVLPAIVSALYLALAIAYYRIGIEKSLDDLSM